MKTRSTWKNRICLIALALVLAIAIALGVVGNYLVSYAIGRAGDGGNRQVALEVDQAAVSEQEAIRHENAAAQELRTEAFLTEVTAQEAEITADDGLTLRGWHFPQEDSHLWALVIHGYRGSHSGMMDYAERYYHAGYQVLTPDLRGCGESEGSFVGMGWPDRLDILQWISWIEQQDPEARIVLHGVSMGAATVMMTAGEDTPDSVAAFVEDCGYTSVWDIFSSELKLRFHLPECPILYIASAIADLRAGYSFREASSLRQVANCEKPMLFIHGTQDDFVPYDMLQLLYDAKPGNNKAVLTVEGAGHGKASSVLGDAYWGGVFDFLSQYGFPSDAA